MVNSFLRRLAPGALVLGLALAGLAVTGSEGVAQDTSGCGNGKGPLCQEIETCRIGPSTLSCGTSYTYYAGVQQT